MSLLHFNFSSSPLQNRIPVRIDRTWTPRSFNPLGHHLDTSLRNSPSHSFGTASPPSFFGNFVNFPFKSLIALPLARQSPLSFLNLRSLPTSPKRVKSQNPWLTRLDCRAIHCSTPFNFSSCQFCWSNSKDPLDFDLRVPLIRFVRALGKYTLPNCVIRNLFQIS